MTTFRSLVLKSAVVFTVFALCVAFNYKTGLSATPPADLVYDTHHSISSTPVTASVHIFVTCRITGVKKNKLDCRAAAQDLPAGVSVTGWNWFANDERAGWTGAGTYSHMQIPFPRDTFIVAEAHLSNGDIYSGYEVVLKPAKDVDCSRQRVPGCDPEDQGWPSDTTGSRF